MTKTYKDMTELPVFETLSNDGNIIEAIEIEHKNGRKWLKPIKELDCATFLTCTNESITMALWHSDPDLNGNIVRKFDCRGLHPRQWDALVAFMGVE